MTEEVTDWTWQEIKVELREDLSDMDWAEAGTPDGNPILVQYYLVYDPEILPSFHELTVRQDEAQAELSHSLREEGGDLTSNDEERGTVHVGELTYECKDCKIKFSSRGKLQYHRRRHHTKLSPTTKSIFDSSEFFCDICFTSIKFRSRFDRHMRMHVGAEPSLKSVLQMYQCDACPQAYRVKEQFILHLESHSTEDPKIPAKCSVCDKNFARLDTLEEHVKAVHESEGPVFDCDLCHYSFEAEEDWKKHQGAHEVDLTRSVVGEHMCAACGQTFLHISALNGHMIQAHSGLRLEPRPKPRVHLRKDQGGKVSGYRRATCPICGKDCWVRGALNNHLLKAHTYEHGLQCYLCNRKFSCRGPLIQHLSKKHEGEEGVMILTRNRISWPRRKAYVCPTCGESHTDAVRLQKHCFNNHQEVYLAENPHYCTACFKNFTTAEEAATHRPVHDLHTCNICGKQFRRAAYLNVHMMHHTGERPWKCNSCDKRFTTIYNLRDHEKIHAKDFGFFCNICPNNSVGFYKNVRLDKHMAKVHGM